MFDTVVLPILGLLILLAGVYAGYQRRVAPHDLDLQGKGLLLLIALTFIGSFAWDVPPLASRMLASAGWSLAVVCFLSRLPLPGAYDSRRFSYARADRFRRTLRARRAANILLNRSVV